MNGVVTLSRIFDLVETLNKDPHCQVAPSVGQPHTQSPYVVPDDLQEFYGLCGGAVLNLGGPFSWSISAPEDLAETNLEMLGEQGLGDITASWHVIAREGDSSASLISIDLSRNRLGWCYDSFYEVHGVVGSCAVLSHSFADLLAQLITARGEVIFWAEDGFVSLGDAYD